MVIPSLVLVENDSSSKAPSRVDASSGNWDGRQMNQEHRESNWKWCQNLYNTIRKLRMQFLYPSNNSNHALIRCRLGLNAFVIRKSYALLNKKTLTGTCESLAFLLASVAEKTV